MLHSWTPAAYQSGRLVCTSFCAHGLWISGHAVYGTPTGPTHVNSKVEVTNALLQQALDRAEQLTGPRFIGGDFNHDWDTLSVIAQMHCLGYRDVQDLDSTVSGVLPRATCRAKTRRDFLFVSREMAQLFVKCEVRDDTVADHSFSRAALMLGLGSLGLCRIRWNGNPTPNVLLCPMTFSMTQPKPRMTIVHFWSQVESQPEDLFGSRPSVP